MGKKNKKGRRTKEGTPECGQDEQSSVSTQQSQQQQQQGSVPQPQQGPRPQQQGPEPQQQGPGSQQQGPGPQQQGPGPQQQGPRPQQQGPRPQHQGPGPQQQWPRPKQQGPGPQQQGPGPQQQGPRPQQQGPGPQQQGPRPQQQGPGPQQQWPRPQQQQQQGPRPEQQQPQGPVPPQQQQPAKELTAAIGKMSLTPQLIERYLNIIPKRRNLNAGGTLGRRITVETNMFALNINGKFRTDITHYDVSITPDKPKFMMRPVFEAFRKKNFPNRYPAYDGRKNAYSASDLPFKESIQGTVEVYNEEKQKSESFTIVIKKAAEIDFSWIKKLCPGFNLTEEKRKGMQALDIILSHGPASQFISAGRSLFPLSQGRPAPLPNAMQVWRGTFMSSVAAWKPYLNIDVSHKAFPTSQSVIDLMKELCGCRDVQSITKRDLQQSAHKINAYLKGLKVQFEIPGKTTSRRTFRVLQVLNVSPKEDMFDNTDDGQRYTVQSYFATKKGYNIVFPDLPCLWVGSQNRNVHLPPELCTIVAGQVVQRKLEPAQTAKMITQTADNTQIRKQKILDAFASVRLNEHDTMKKEFQLSVSGELAEVPARVLAPPKLQYDREVQVRRGTWNAGKFIQPTPLQDCSWTILNLDDRTRENTLRDLEQKLKLQADRLGMNIGKAYTPFASIQSHTLDKSAIASSLQKMKQNNLKLVIVILPQWPDNIYSLVKQASELGVNLLTQCIKGTTLYPLKDKTLENILLKLNSKLNGINHIFHLTVRPHCFKQSCILFGADVTHPSPDAVNIPSIAAVAASHDLKAFQYNIEMRLQPARLEIIEDLCSIVQLQLRFFHKKTGCKPERVIFYRDGVSEGQLPQVMHYEITAIKQAFKSLQSDYNPPLTFLVVQKRHHIRLFPTDERNAEGKDLNVQAGTVVDTDITHPSHIDFYLVSHASIRGTARPTKYRCLLNDNKLTEDDIEQLTYYLCHMFARCTRSVSYPAPTYYAHLAAFRARALIHSVPIRMDQLREEQRSKLTLRINQDNPMFFV